MKLTKILFCIFILLVLTFSLVVAKDQCSEGQVYDNTLKECVLDTGCSNGYEWNELDQKCEKIKTNHGKIEKDTTLGKVKFKTDIKSDKNKNVLEYAVKIGWGTISIDSKQYPELNQPATLTYKNTCFKNPIVLYNGQWDKSVKITNTGLCEYEVDVEHFSNWSLVDSTWNGTHNRTTVWDSGLGLDTNAVMLLNFENNTYEDSCTTTGNITLCEIADGLQYDFISSFSNIKNITDWRKDSKSIALINLPFDGRKLAESGNKIKDYSTNGKNFTENLGSVANYCATCGIDGKGAYNYTGLGTQNIVYYNNLNLGTNDFTFSLWEKMQNGGSGGNYATLFQDNYYHSSYDGTYVTYITPTGMLFASYDHRTNGENTAISYNFTLNEWYHIAISRDNNILKIYVNGEWKKNGTLTKSLGSGSDFNIGKGALGEYKPVIIDEFIIFNRSLSDEQIYNIYNNQSNIISDEYLNVGDNFSVCITPNNNTADYTQQCSDGKIVTKVFNIVNETEDLSYYDQNVTLYNGVETSESVTSTSLKFDGIDDYGIIDYNTKLNMNESISISLWLNLTSRTNAGRILSKSNSYELLFSGDGTRLQANIVRPSLLSYSEYTNVNFPLNENVHIVATYYNDDIKFYFNGVEQNTTISTSVSGSINTNTNDIYISKNQYVADKEINATIDQLYIFDYELTQTQVNELYTKYTDEETEDFIFYPTGNYISEIYNATVEDPQVGTNLWLATIFDNNTGIDSIYGRAGDCTTLETEDWTLGTFNGSAYTFNGEQGECFQYNMLVGLTSPFIYYNNVTIESYGIYVPNVTDINIYPEDIYAPTTIYGNATFLLNDTDEGYLVFDWVVNDVIVETDIEYVAGNGSNAEVNMSGLFSKFDTIYFNVTPYANSSYGVAQGGTTSSSDKIVLNSDFTISSYYPTITNFTKYVNSRQLFYINLIDVDNDAICNWNIINDISPITQTGTGFSKVVSTYGYSSGETLNINCSCSDGEYTHEKLWYVTLTDNPNVDDTNVVTNSPVIYVRLGYVLHFD